MPFGEIVQCNKCDKNESFMWHRDVKGLNCNDCYESEQPSVKLVDEEEQKPSVSVEKPKSTSKKNSKNTRSYKTRQNPNAVLKQVPLKGKGKRIIFKKNPPIKLTAAKATITTSSSVFYKGEYRRIGDIVSVKDVDGGTYFAQIKGLMTDEYCEQSASLTWLIPTRTQSHCTENVFDPLSYVLGPDEDLPRKLDYLKFITHAPPDYFQSKNPYPTDMPHPKEPGYIWRRLK